MKRLPARLCAALLGAGLAAAGPCETAIHSAERAQAIPTGLLAAIGRVEAGRRDPATGAATIWPWTINAAGAGFYLADSTAAQASTEAFQSQGIASVDVGCVQINLLHHPHAFASLDEAFMPDRNAAYGARFLRSLYARTGTWPAAVAAYHSLTPELGQAYASRVMATWQGAPLQRQTPTPATPEGPYAAWPPPGQAYAAIPPASYAYRAMARPAAPLPQGP
jgi:hypothetical protein